MKSLLLLFVFIFQVESMAAPSCQQIFSPDRSTPTQTVTKTESTLEHLRQHTDQGLKPHRSEINSLTEALRQIAKRDPTMAKLFKMFETKQYTFAMDRSPDQRINILSKNEFLNIHQAKESAGAYQPQRRAHVEAEYLGLPLKTYANLPDAVKPKSMYLIPDSSTGIEATPTVYFYDPVVNKSTGDTWIFDLKKIEHNTAFVVGDSYNRALIQRGLADDIKQFTVLPDAHFKKDNVMDYALPLDLLDSAIPYYYDQVRRANKFQFVNEDSPKYKKRFEELKEDMGGHLPEWQSILLNDQLPDFDKAFFKKFPELKPFQETFLIQPYGNYVEGLYYGALPVRGHVKAFIFRTNPPTPEDLAKFKEFGIQVIDGR